jgi:hypothetical protein
MRQLFFSFFLFISSTVCAQDTVRQEIRVVGSGSMSDLPFAVQANGEHVAHFSFSPSVGDVTLEIALWEASPDTDSLSKTVLFREYLTKNERTRVDLLVDLNGTQVDIKSIMAGKMMVVTPVKPQNGRIQPFLFRSNPRIEGTSVPVALLIDSNREFVETDLMHLLTVQYLRLIGTQTIRELKKQTGGFKILSYHQEKQP